MAGLMSEIVEGLQWLPGLDNGALLVWFQVSWDGGWIKSSSDCQCL